MGQSVRTWAPRYVGDFELETIDEPPYLEALVHQLFTVQQGEAGLMTMIETESVVTITLGKMVINATANLLRDHEAAIESHWEYADPRDRWFPEMHTGQVALANEVRSKFSVFEAALYDMANDDDKKAMRDPAWVFVASTRFLEEEIDRLIERVSRLAAPG